MPTHEEEESFWHDWDRLTLEQQDAFLAAVDKMVDDMKSGHRFRKGLRVKGVQGHLGIFEMTWADDGRATFNFGTSPRPGDTHIIWRRIGAHDILKNP
jgi:hypothetical protein